MEPRYRGPRRLPAHVKTMLTARRCRSGPEGELRWAWQAIYLIEHRARPHRREIVLQFTVHA